MWNQSCRHQTHEETGQTPLQGFSTVPQSIPPPPAEGESYLTESSSYQSGGNVTQDDKGDSRHRHAFIKKEYAEKRSGEDVAGTGKIRIFVIPQNRSQEPIQKTMQGKLPQPNYIYYNGTQYERAENEQRQRAGQEEVTNGDREGEKMDRLPFELVVK